MCECAYYQNEDEPHPLAPHAVNQVRQAGELRAQDKVQLTLHVVDVCVLHILQTTAFRDEFSNSDRENIIIFQSFYLYQG